MRRESVYIETADLVRLTRAVSLLERNSLVTMLAQAVGRPVTAILGSLPNIASVAIQQASRKAILQCLRIAARPAPQGKLAGLAGRYPRLITGIAGAAGGLAGLPGVAIELPITTVVMFHAIARIALDEGEDFTNPEARLACLEVFALSTTGRGPARSESGYYGARNSLATSLDEAASYVLRRSTSQQSAPALVRFTSAIAARFGVLVSEELAATAIPLIGAVTGASLNLIFMQHFNDIARGHFAVRALERKYGTRVIRERFEQIRKAIENRKQARSRHPASQALTHTPSSK